MELQEWLQRLQQDVPGQTRRQNCLCRMAEPNRLDPRALICVPLIQSSICPQRLLELIVVDDVSIAAAGQSDTRKGFTDSIARNSNSRTVTRKGLTDSIARNSNSRTISRKGFTDSIAQNSNSRTISRKGFTNSIAHNSNSRTVRYTQKIHRQTSAHTTSHTGLGTPLPNHTVATMQLRTCTCLRPGRNLLISRSESIGSSACRLSVVLGNRQFCNSVQSDRGKPSTNMLACQILNARACATCVASHTALRLHQPTALPGTKLLPPPGVRLLVATVHTWLRGVFAKMTTGHALMLEVLGR
eukprot:366453-Chlamydomonas_euryale.AAC.12